MANLKYTYALDENKEYLVHIDDAEKGRIYYCPYSECNEQMIVRDGGNNRKHFSHINNGKKCSYDSYLHTIAEIRFRHWFLSEKSMTIQLNKYYCANYKNCIWRDNYSYDTNNYCIVDKSMDDQSSEFHIINEIYNGIEVEKKFNGFIWDILLSNTKNKNKPPLAIEIFVTHKCEKKKIASGVRIIEVKIKNEKQLDEIISTGTLIEGKHFESYNLKKYTDNVDGIYLDKVTLNKNLKASWKEVHCKSYKQRNYNSIFEITFDYENSAKDISLNPYYWACSILKKKFKSFLHCSLCKFYKYNDYHNEHICIRYKELKLENKHTPSNAVNCPKFEINKQQVEEAPEYLKYLSYNVWEKGENIEGRHFKKEIEE